MQGYAVRMDKASGMEVEVVCIFKDPKTYMMLESATLDSDQAQTLLNYEVVNGNQLSRHIDVKEYGSERIFLSHREGLGSVHFRLISQ